MRTLIDIAETQIDALDELARARAQSRAALVREAVADFLTRHRPGHSAEAFGLWAQTTEDGVAYQDRMRRDW